MGLKAIKITNAQWLPTIGEHIQEFTNKANIDGIHGPNYYAFVAQTVQRGGDMAEFWVIIDEHDEAVQNPYGFGHWHVPDIPHIAKVYCHAIYCWGKQQGATELLVDEFRKFGIRHRAVWYSADFISKAVAKLFIKITKGFGYTTRETGIINIIAKRG